MDFGMRQGNISKDLSLLETEGIWFLFLLNKFKFGYFFSDMFRVYLELD